MGCSERLLGRSSRFPEKFLEASGLRGVQMVVKEVPGSVVLQGPASGLRRTNMHTL